MFKPITLALIAALSGTAALAQTGDGYRLSGEAFDHIDTTGAGQIDLAQYINAGKDVFAAMEYDGDGKVSLSEFLVFDIGMRPIAEAAGRADALETGLRVVFAFWDRNGDGLLSTSEHRTAMNMDFQRADDDGNALLTRDEFLDGFTVMVAARAAINPAPAD